MSNEIAINPALLTWARERARLDVERLEGRFPKLVAWEAGEVQPTLRQLEDFAHAVHVPIGYLFLPQPIQEQLPIPDFRTMKSQAILAPSPNLLDILYLCQQRQDWYRDYANLHRFQALDFIGTVTIRHDPILVAETMRARLQIALEERQQLATVSEALGHLIRKAEDAGVLVMASSIVGSNSHRKLEVAEFRGFVLADKFAPLVFLNAADSKAGQNFTLAHELAHLWLGTSGVSNSEAGRLPELAIERWCNMVAAEFLMPLSATRAAYQPEQALPSEMQRLARRFKVSTLVALRRLLDAGFIDEATHWQQYQYELARIQNQERKGSGGGNFYRTLSARTGKRFARAVLASTLEGQTLFQEAFRMLGIKKSATFYAAARELEVLP